MLDPFLTEALRRLDERLLAVCDAEERRAAKLTGDGRTGWDGVRNMIRPTVDDLLNTGSSFEERLLPDEPHALHRIGAELKLDACEAEALVVMIAPHLEPRYQSLYAVLQDDLRQGRPTERLLLGVAGGTVERRQRLKASLAPGGLLCRSGILIADSGSAAPLGRSFAMSDDTAAVLTGVAVPQIAGALRQTLLPGAAEPGTEQAAACLVLHGRGDLISAGCRLVAPGQRLLLVKVPGSSSAVSVCQAAWRLGLAAGCLPLLDCSDIEETERRPLGDAIQSWVATLGGRAWIASAAPLPLTVPHIECTAPSWAQRAEAWRCAAAAAGLRLSEDEVHGLATRHRLQPSVMTEMVAGCRVTDAQALDAMARRLAPATVRHSNAVKTESTLDDLVLRDTTRSALEQLIYFARHRDRVALERKLARRYRLDTGPLVLFAGRSGTGKTVAAEAVATALGLRLHSVDLSQLISKYIGDTEKHIDNALTEAERAPAVLFFDEADVLFSSRQEKASSGAEQFANMVVGYLLQRMERHDGVVILATNLRHAIDEAFLRRFQFRIEFPLPERDERRRIWELFLPPSIMRDEALDLAKIARQHRLSGGEIRNVALRAIFLAEAERAKLAAHHVEEAIAVELLELGRLSRRPPGSAGPGVHDPDGEAGSDRGHRLRAVGDLLESALEPTLRALFRKEIHLVQGSPTDRNLAGRRPAMSVALFRVAGRRSGPGFRAGFIVSAWSHRAEEELELLGVAHETLSRLGVVSTPGMTAQFRIQESHDFDLLHRFWSSHEHPMKPSIVVDVEVDGPP
ncbi:MAG: ATP-binding protein [Acetobacteraceae bacterium]